MQIPGWGEMTIILIVVLVLFGGKKIPELARSLGLGIKEFKKAKDEIKNEVKSVAEDVELENENN